MEAPSPRAEHYTYADLLKWPDDERWELIEGRAYALTPGPNERHQWLFSLLIHAFLNFFEDKPCRVYGAPFDVLLPDGDETDEAIDTILQPDIMVVCDPAKIKKRGIRGAPDLVLEILSVSTVERDLGDKLRLYEKHGARCYIIADPWGKSLTVRYLDANGHYGEPEFYSESKPMPIRIFEGLILDLPKIFSRY